MLFPDTCLRIWLNQSQPELLVCRLEQENDVMDNDWFNLFQEYTSEDERTIKDFLITRDNGFVYFFFDFRKL